VYLLAAMAWWGAVADAERLDDVSGAFSFEAPGSWVASGAEGDLSVYAAQDAEHQPLRIYSIILPADPNAPLFDELEPLISLRATASFPEAGVFTKRTVKALGSPQDALRFLYSRDGEDGAGYALGFVARGQCCVIIVAGPASFTGLAALADAVLGSVSPGAGAAPVASPDGEGDADEPPSPLDDERPPDKPQQPEGGQTRPGQAAGESAGGWAIADLPSQMGVEVRDTTGTGVVAELKLVPLTSTSAPAVLRALLPQLPVEGLTVLEAQQTPDKRFARCTYTGTRGGEAVKGEFAVSAGEGLGVTEHIWAPGAPPEARLKAARRVLEQMLRAGGEGAGGLDLAAADQVVLTRQNNRDGSAWMDVPAGWQVTEGSGIAYARGPEDLGVLVGAHSQFWTQQGARVVRQYGGQVGGLGAPISDLLGPDQAVAAMLPWVAATQNVEVADLEVVKTWPLPKQPGTVGQHIRYTLRGVGGTKAMEGVAYVMSGPLSNVQWFGSINLLSAPQATFDRNLPLLWRIYTTYGISQVLLSQRWAQVMKDQDAITAIIQDVTADRAETTTLEAERWDKVIRGVTPVIDPTTGETRDISIDPHWGGQDMEKWLQDNPNLPLGKLEVGL
jgi:P2-related tail formation protein